jgi:hypothetical protein
VFLLLVTVTLVACESRTSASFAELLEGVEPFSALQGVGFGSRARDLKAHRPAIAPAAYVGYAEQIGEYAVLYYFPGVEWNENQVPPAGRKRMRSIEARRLFPNYAAALHAWTEQVASASRALPVQPQCYRVPPGHRRSGATIAEWKLPGGTFSIVAAEGNRVKSLTGTREAPGWMLLKLSRQPSWGTRMRQRLLGRTKEDQGRIAQPCSTHGP